MIEFAYVAFIDVLGFSEMVLADCESSTPGQIFLPKMRAAMHSALANADAVDAKITQFSDSIVAASPFGPTPDKLQNFINVISNLQRYLFMEGILCRGGISHGRHYDDGTLLFSQGLIESYRLESQVAKDPRVLLSTDTHSLVCPNGDGLDGIIKDGDGLMFIDYLSSVSLPDIKAALAAFEPNLTSKNLSVRSKIAWLFRYANFCYEEVALPDGISLRRC